MASAEVCVNGEAAKDHLIGPGGDADIKEKTTLDDNQTDSPGKAAVTMETASGGSPAKPTLEPAEPSEEAFNDIDASSVASSESVLTATTSTSLATNAPSELVLTEEIIKEEQKWEKETAKEEEEETLRRQKLWAMMSEDSKGERYARLQFLLSKSNMYTEYLLERMESQKKEEKQRRLKTTKRKDKEDKSALSQESVSSTSIPNSPAIEEATEKLRSPRRKLPAPKSKSAVTDSVGSPVVEKENDSPDQDKTETDSLNGSQSSKRGRKRKGTEENTKSIVNFLQPDAKRKKTDEKNQSQKKKDLPDNLEPMIDEDGSLIRPALMTGGDLRKYQIEGLNWLKVLYENGVNGILADEMGLGKTVQCIALIAHLGYNCIPGPFMVVAPLSTLPNWRSEFNRFCPQIPVLFYHGTPEERANLRHKIRKLHAVTKDVSMRPVVITSYEMTMRDRSALKDIEWRYLIVDEGHRIKNWQCKLVRELKQYKNTHRLLLTGTPLQNNLSELWSLLNFLLPEIFDDLGSFESWFDIAVISEEGADEAIVEAEQRKNILSMLHQILTPFMLRRVKTDVDLMIPPKKELIVYAPMTKEQQEFYTATVDRTILQKIEEKNTVDEKVEMSEAGRPRRRSTMRKVNYKAMMESENDVKVPNNKRKDEEELESWVQEMWEFNNTSVAKEEKQKVSQVTIRLQNIMMQLRKCCNHPYLLEYPLDKTGEYKMDEELVTKCGKMLILDKMLTQLKKRGHKVLIFSQMTKMLDILQDFCEFKNLKYCRLDGSCSVENRHEQMQSFNTDPSVFVFLLSTRAGGLGINLMAADTVIIYDSDWNPQCDLQAQDRCHRIGQTRPVVVYRFVTADTIDQRIVERAAAKRKLEKMVIHKGKFKTGIKNFSRDIKPLSPEELMALLKSRDHCREINQGSDAAISDQELDLLLDRSDLYEEFERTAKRLGAEIKVDGKKAKGKKKANNKKKPEESNLFKVIDFTDGGSTLEAKTDSQSDEQTDSQTEVKMDTDDSQDSQKQSQETQDHKLDVPVNA